MKPELHKAIRSAIKSGDKIQLQALLLENEDAATMDTPFGSWLHVAASFGKIDIVRMLIEEHGLNIDANGGVAGGSALHRAATDGHHDVVNYLLDIGAKMDTSEPERNPLFGAILGRHLEIAKTLIARGIDKDIYYSGPSMVQMNALAFARERGATEFFPILEEERQKGASAL